MSHTACILGLYRWTKFGWNRCSHSGYYAILSPLIDTWRTSHHFAYYMKTWRHPQNRKYITYRNTARDNVLQNVVNLCRVLSNILSWQTDKRRAPIQLLAALFSVTILSEHAWNLALDLGTPPYYCVTPKSSFLARDVIYTYRAYATVSVCLCVCLWRKCIGAL